MNDNQDDDNDKQKSILLPKYIWTVIAALASLATVLLASFFSWLGITTTNQGEQLRLNGYQIEQMGGTLEKISDKVSELPPKEFITYPLRIQSLEADAMNREAQLDLLEKRVDENEKQLLRVGK